MSVQVGGVNGLVGGIGGWLVLGGLGSTVAAYQYLAAPSCLVIHLLRYNGTLFKSLRKLTYPSVLLLCVID